MSLLQGNIHLILHLKEVRTQQTDGQRECKVEEVGRGNERETWVRGTKTNL